MGERIACSGQLTVLQPAEVEPEDRALLDSAFAAAQHAYAPYSHFLVGAAVLLADGRVVTGCNQEDPAFPSGLCAERVALFAAGAAAPGVEIRTVAIVSPVPTAHTSFTPCGSCRQVLHTFGSRQTAAFRILLQAADGPVVEASGPEVFLPWAFSSDALG
jgi:cytidine deaminase